MLNPKLQQAYKSFVRWCEHNGLVFDQVCDEDDLQSYLIPRRYSSLTPRLSEFLGALCQRTGLHCREQRTRSGTVYALSLTAIAEATMDALVPTIDRSRLARRLDLVYDGLWPFQRDLLHQIEEAQYHAPSTAQRRQYTRPTQTIGHKLTKKLQESLGYMPIALVVLEALDGIAADYQPMDVLRQFEGALRQLGLLDNLRAAGVTNRLSRDKQVLHFYVSDSSGLEREVASYELVKLAEGNTMETAIKDLKDLARRRAPGTTDREIEHINDQQKKIREVAKQHSPAVLKQAQEMQAQQTGTQPASGPIESVILSRFEELLAGDR